ncbi:MAG: alpha/beta hydrolase [Spirosomataceae bacterium]
MKINFINVPGLSNSGPTHWQTIWEEESPTQFVRVKQHNWELPDRTDWVFNLEQLIQVQTVPFMLVAHSLGCLAVAHWAERHYSPLLLGALLVAPADAERSPESVLASFAPIPRTPLGFPSTVVASTNDPYMTFPKAADLAASWGSQLVNIGAKGHINAASRLGDWYEGRKLLFRLQHASIAYRRNAVLA